jgi:phosphatidylglycerol lysyltransferase
MQYIDEPNVGYVAFKSVGAIRSTGFILGDPLCSKENLSIILDRIQDQIRDPIFIQVSKATAAALGRRGFYVNQLGIETTLNLADWDLRGAKKQNLRTPLNRMKRQGICIQEVDRTALYQAVVQRISEEWLQKKPGGMREICFLAAPLESMNHNGVRTFVAERFGEVLAIAYFTPTFDSGRVTGYYSDVVRTSAAAPPKLAYVVKTVAALQFKDEGLETLSLGLSPAFCVEDKEDLNSPFTTVLATGVFQYSNSLYSFKGIAKSKRYFGGQETHVYLCTRHRYPVWQLYRLFKACNISPGGRLLSAFTRRAKSA